jgi:glycosyltransferase involved in cell wall biosynthesis
LSNVYAVAVAERFAARFIAYDCNDAHSAFPGMPVWTRDYFERSCRGADTVVATSVALVEEAERLRGDGGVTFIGNGVDVAHFERERGRLQEGLSSGPPCVGYLGALAPWFDFRLVEQLARARPDWRVRLVGPVLPGAGSNVERLAALPNVTVEGAVPYDDVPAVMRSFTVGLIPFCYDELTRAVNPNKMYEYLAMGVPVVATRFSPEVRRYPGLVTAAADGDEFMVACDEFVRLADDPQRLASFRSEAIAVAREHDWDVIAGSFWSHIQQTSDRFAQPSSGGG